MTFENESRHEILKFESRCSVTTEQWECRTRRLIIPRQVVFRLDFRIASANAGTERAERPNAGPSQWNLPYHARPAGPQRAIPPAVAEDNQ
jgi:hypothetical protein